MGSALPLKAPNARAERAVERARENALRAQIDELNAEMVVARAEADRALAEERQRVDRLNEQMEALSAEVVRVEKQAEAAVGRAERAEAGRDAERARAEMLHTALVTQEAAAELRRAEAERRARGLLAWYPPPVRPTCAATRPGAWARRGDENRRRARRARRERPCRLPDTLAKWVRLQDRRIAGFTTYMMREVFGALREHTILGRMVRDAPLDTAAFDRGVARSADPGGLLHQLFGLRMLGLMDRLAEDPAPFYLSALLIGSEIRSSLTPGPPSI